MVERADAEPGVALARLSAIIARLRDPATGCAWDVAQTFTTIAPYTIEEAYEVADAITRDDMADLQDELGDLQLQIAFHAQIAAEAGHFTLNDVIVGIADKMERRHLHVFHGTASASWETIKAAERRERRETGALAGVALGLPALMRGDKLGRRAAQVGFDWPDAGGARAKIAEELAELDAARNHAERHEELGDLLLAVTSWARLSGLDAEVALRDANLKFERRFKIMEAESSASLSALTASEKEALWQSAKALEGRDPSRPALDARDCLG